MKKQIGIVIGVALSLSMLGGCASSIVYKPMAGAAPAAASSVAVTVKDDRPADQGGSDKSQVGVTRGGYGIPSAMNDSDPAVVTRTVTEATTDALRQAGVEAKAGGKTLVASVKSYWMDGYVGYVGTVTVNYVLQDASGKMLWSSEVSGEGGGTNLFKGSQNAAQDIFLAALTDLATKASAEFKSAAFQSALK